MNTQTQNSQKPVLTIPANILWALLTQNEEVMLRITKAAEEAIFQRLIDGRMMKLFEARLDEALGMKGKAARIDIAGKVREAVLHQVTKSANDLLANNGQELVFQTINARVTTEVDKKFPYIVEKAAKKAAARISVNIARDEGEEGEKKGTKQTK